MLVNTKAPFEVICVKNTFADQATVPVDTINHPYVLVLTRSVKMQKDFEIKAVMIRVPPLPPLTPGGCLKAFMTSGTGQVVGLSLSLTSISTAA